MDNTKKKVKPNVNNEGDVEKIRKNLENYIHIHERHYHLIPLFTRVRYINRETGDFYYGGFLISNKSPDSIVLRGIGYNSNWRIDPKKMTLFVEDGRYRKQEQCKKNNLYKLYTEGKLQFHINPNETIDI